MFRNLFFPSTKYNKKYTKFVGWSFISNILVSTEGVIATHGMLSCLGTQNNDIVLTSNYIGKDIIGQLGGLYYMSKMGQHVDKDPKKFLKYTNITQQTALFMEAMTPFVHHSYFLYIAGGANVLKNISYTGYGAINAKCIKELSIDDNIGEIYAKISVINTLGSSIGMGLGVWFIALFKEYYLSVGILPILGLLRIYTFNKAIKDL